MSRYYPPRSTTPAASARKGRAATAKELPDGLARGQRVEVDITSVSPLGDGTAMFDGVELQVPGALPGERARVRIEHRSRQTPRAWTVLEAVTHPSRARREPPCPHHGHCTGCALMMADEHAQRRFKEQMLRERFGLNVDRFVFREDSELGYRWSSKRVTGRSRDGLVLGSFRRGTHRVVSMTGCLVEHPLVSRCADELEQVARSEQVEPATAAAPATTALALKAAWIRTDGAASCFLGLVGPRPPVERAQRLARALSVPTAVTWSVTPQGDGDGLRGAETESLRGPSRLRVTVAGATVEVGSMGFLQPNPPVAELAYRDLLTSTAGEPLSGRRALDLYAGAGATTRLLREHFDEVVACDADPESAASLGRPALGAEELLAAELARKGTAASLVVADPPRAGLGERVTQSLTELGPERIHLMSCHPASIRRDLDALTGPDGGYRLEGCRAYDTLPQTPHVELVAWLSRRKS